MKSKSGFGLMVLTLAACLMFYSTGVYAADVVKIGASHPLSGGVAENASWAVEGIKMVVEETNAKGGISIQGKNLKVELILYDSKCDPTTGVANVEKMINRDKVVAINGDTCSTCCLAQKEVSGRAKIIQVTPIAVHPKITEPGYPYMFRTVNTIDMYAYPFVEFIAKELKNVKSVALLAVTDDYGRSAVKIYTELLTKNGIKITDTEYLKHGDTDFYTQITKLLAAKPDAIYVVSNEDSQNIGTLKQIKELGFKGVLFGCSTYNTDNMIKLGGEKLLEGLYMEGPTFEWVKNKPEVKEWIQRYAKRFGRDANAFSVFGYQSMQLLVDVIRRANTLTDREKIREAMVKSDLPGVMLGFEGKRNFDKNGQAHPYLCVVQWQNGKRMVVYRQKEEK